jgi:hypothetical protein
MIVQARWIQTTYIPAIVQNLSCVQVVKLQSVAARPVTSLDGVLMAEAYIMQHRIDVFGPMRPNALLMVIMAFHPNYDRN